MQMEKIKSLVAPVLPWTDEKWDKEIEQYYRIWKNAYSLLC